VTGSLLTSVGAFFLLALTAMTIQNAVFARALGISRLISLIDDTTNTLIFGILLSIVNVLSGVFCFLLNTFWLHNFSQATLVRPLAMVVCMSTAFSLVFVLAVKFAPRKHILQAVSALPPATFNCTVIGTLLIATTSQFSLANTIAFGLGSSAGFVLAVLLVTEGQRRLQNRSIPAAFKGLPATLLFLAGLAMAVYGLAGHGFSF
jgi:Na+-translocating ferredoxin:NAD+ oxidoreductase RnfA subunit